MLTPDSILSPWLPIRVCLAVMLETANFNALLDVSNKQPHAPTIDAKLSNMYDAVLLKKSGKFAKWKKIHITIVLLKRYINQ